MIIIVNKIIVPYGQDWWIIESKKFKDNKEYDMFIALQVWEHLVGRQREAFNEVMRISKMAILSFPYMWNCPEDNANYPEHHMIDEKIISEWTLGVEPMKIVKIPRTGEKVSKGPRLIYFWRF